MNANMQHEADSNWLIDDDQPGDDDEADARPTPWRVMIVDDDVDVHVVTKFSLSNTSFMGRRISFLHAYSAAEAMTVLQGTPDVALILLDVIMESDDAGLRLAHRIRTELGNKTVRIVLRTGQAGQALEKSVIVDNDISDFWCKTDLTTRKLFTTVIASLRTYAVLRDCQQRVSELNVAAASLADGAAPGAATMALSLNRLGTVDAVDARLCHLLRWRRDDVLGQHWLQWQGNGQHAIPCGELAQAIEQGQRWAGAVTLRARDGREHDLRALLLPLAAQAEHGSAAVLLLTEI
ncbi:MAG: response regulator [Pseudomonadota bacterium]